MIQVVLLLLVPLLASCKVLGKPVDCNAIHHQNRNLRSGVYTIYPAGKRSAVKVYCDMRLSGGGWTVIQRRKDGSVNFYRPWDHYKFGFGNPAGEYWLGLRNIHYLTKQRRYELRIDMEDFTGQKVFAKYSSFSVGAEGDGYKLHISGFINGGAGDALPSHNGQKFSTFDKDQDSWSGNCARQYHGGFWYNSCHQANPNGDYRWGVDDQFAIGVNWQQWKGYYYSLKSFSMKIRPVK